MLSSKFSEFLRRTTHTFSVVKHYQKLFEKNQYQKAYCIICQNRAFSLKEGVICGLTNSLPKFEKKCNEFKLDVNELSKKTTDFKSKIESDYIKPEDKDFWTDPDSIVYYDRSRLKSKLKKNFNKGVNITFIRNKFDLTYNLLGYLGILAMIVYGNIKHNKGWDLQSSSTIFLIAYTLLGLIYISYFYFSDRKYIISFNESSININGLKLHWNNILDYIILEERNSDTIVLFTALNGIQKIEMYQFDNTALDIASIIETNKETFYNNGYN